MFFSVDVETGHTVATEGALLSIGAVAITEDTFDMVDSFYCNLAYDDRFLDPDTMNWWKQQEEDVRDEAFNWAHNRLYPPSAAAKFDVWLSKLEPEKENRFFVANPASFDFSWIVMLYNTNNLEVPFNHRTLCLRSMRFGITGGKFGRSRGEDNEHWPSLVPSHNNHPHHAHHDAIAQGYDLINMLKLIQ